MAELIILTRPVICRVKCRSYVPKQPDLSTKPAPAPTAKTLLYYLRSQQWHPPCHSRSLFCDVIREPQLLAYLERGPLYDAQPKSNSNHSLSSARCGVRLDFGLCGWSNSPSELHASPSRHVLTTKVIKLVLRRVTLRPCKAASRNVA